MTIGSLFSGVGGLELGLERAGLGPVLWQAEIDPFCRSVLAKHWPEARRYEDVRAVDESAERVDVICGGFPCQPHSVAGKRRGTADERWLWPEFARVVAAVRPRWVVIENVPALRSSGLRDVLADLAAMRFDAWWTGLSAAAVGAPHQRTRLFVLAADADRVDVREQPGGGCWPDWAGALLAVRDGETRPAADADGEGQPQPSGALANQWGRSSDGGWWSPVSAVRRVDDGIPDRFHGRRLKALGNAVVPQCAEVIGRVIVDAEARS